MEKGFYDLAEILICDPVVSNRAVTRSTLHALGCRHIEIVNSLSEFLDALDNRPPDLALCEAQVGEADLCDAIRKLRCGEGYNPFVIIIVTAWKINCTLTREIMKSGADGLLLRPFSAAILDERIRTYVLNQKRFIVTDSYVGPERREIENSSSTAFSFVPPNSLKMKIEGHPRIDDAIRRFNAELRAANVRLVAEQQRRAALMPQNKGRDGEP
jgi:CheY-like chemotaxis protein